MEYNGSITDIIKTRYSCRSYKKQQLDKETIDNLNQKINAITPPPFKSSIRFNIIWASEENNTALKNLGTYGMISNPAAYLIGAVEEEGDYNMVDFGYSMEQIILASTDLNIGSCWLGGTFKQSAFSKKINLINTETVPAVASLGHIAEKTTIIDRTTRKFAKARHRKPWETIFFKNDFNTPLLKEEAGNFSKILEMIRIAPSASNVQPWRIIMDDNNSFHFFIHRSERYTKRLKRVKCADLQMVDMGIAMCHFDLVAQDLKLKGRWEIIDSKSNQNNRNQYIATWKQI